MRERGGAGGERGDRASQVQESGAGESSSEEVWEDIRDEPTLSEEEEDEFGTTQGEIGRLGRSLNLIESRLHHSRLDSNSTNGGTRYRDSGASALTFDSDDIRNLSQVRTSSRLTRDSGNLATEDEGAEQVDEEDEPEDDSEVSGEEEENSGEEGGGEGEWIQRNRTLAQQTLVGTQPTMAQPTSINSQSPPSSHIASGHNSISASPQPCESLPSARTPDTSDTSPPSIVSETTNSSPRPPFVSVATGPLAQLSPNLSRDSRTVSHFLADLCCAMYSDTN